MVNLSLMEDAELATLIRGTDEDLRNESMRELIRRFSSNIKYLAYLKRSHFCSLDDLIQEGQIALLSAATTFDQARGAFRPFAYFCIKRKMDTYLKECSRAKHKVLTHAVSLDIPYWDDPDSTLVDFIPSTRSEPHSLVVSKENEQEFWTNLRESLTPLEYRVAVLSMNGETLRYISECVGINLKAVDNALQRVRRKLRRVYQMDEYRGVGYASKVVQG